MMSTPAFAARRLLDALRRNRWCLSVGITGGIRRNTQDFKETVKSDRPEPSRPSRLDVPSKRAVASIAGNLAMWHIGYMGRPKQTPAGKQLIFLLTSRTLHRVHYQHGGQAKTLPQFGDDPASHRRRSYLWL